MRGQTELLLIFVSLLGLASLGSAAYFPYVYPRINLAREKISSDAGKALFLTPYLKAGDIAIAQNLSRVSLTEQKGVRSHAGIFTVNEKFNSSMYFWYFPPSSDADNAPVLLWLQGGPGATSLFGLFTELGPLVAEKGGFSLRKYHWALNNHLIFIDNPVGTGFSFTDHDEGYCNNEECIGANLHCAMNQFFTMFPHLRSSEFFITGESYAGKYIPALAKQIHIKNSEVPSEWINLKGLAMGNAYCDPVNQIDYGQYLYQHGLLDLNQLTVFENVQKKIITAINNKNWLSADILMDLLLDGSIGNFSYFNSFTGFDNYYNILETKVKIDTSIFSDLLSNPDIRRGIHVGDLPFNSGTAVQRHLVNDILLSMSATVAELLSHYRVLLYNGQLDIIVAYPLTEKFVCNMNFSSSDVYKNAIRKVWKVDDEIAGYVKMAGNLTEILVRNAGHMVPKDQPKWAYDMINRFVRNKF